MPRTGLPGLFEERMERLEIPSQVKLRALLARDGCRVSATTVSKWFQGAPIRRAHLRVLLDVLDVHGAERDRAYRLAAEGPENALAGAS